MLVEVTARIRVNVAEMGMARTIVNKRLIESGADMFTIDEKVKVVEL